jgi:spermine oxidase
VFFNKLNTLDFNVKSNQEKTVFVTQEGKKVSLEFAKSIYETITRIISSAEHVAINQSNTNKENRVGDYLYDKYVEIVRKELGKDLLDTNVEDADLRRILNGLFLMRAKREHIRSGCSNLFNLSLRNFACYQQQDGISYVELEKGYRPILDAIIGANKQAFESRVHLKHFLKKIILSPELCEGEQLYDRRNEHSKYTSDKNKVVLIMCDATDPKKPKDFAVVCDNVLCTMSLGFLKENINTILEPLSLVSDERRQAVQKLGFGTINKIFLFYDEPFWNENLELMNMIWLPEDDSFRLDKLSYANAGRKVWHEDICKFEVVGSYPNALSAWIAGSEEFEKLDDATIAGDCTALLRKFLSNQNIPEPKSIIR